MDVNLGMRSYTNSYTDDRNIRKVPHNGFEITKERDNTDEFYSLKLSVPVN